MRMLARLLVGAVLLSQAATSAPANPTFYLSCWQLNTVGVATGSEITQAVQVGDLRGVGLDPIQTALSPNGSTLYTLGRGHSTPNGYYLSKIDTGTDEYVSRIRLGFYPLQFVITPDNKQALVRDHARITAVNLRTGAFTYFKNLLPIDEALSPDGRTLYEVGLDGNLLAIDTAKDTIAATVLVNRSSPPDAVAVSSDSKSVYVVTGAQVEVIDAATHAVTATIPVPTSVGGRYHQHLAVTPDGHELYVYAAGRGTYSVIDTATSTVTNTVTPPQRLTAPAFAPGGALAYGLGSSNGYAITAATGAIVSTGTGFASGQHAVAVTGDDRTAVVIQQNTGTLIEQDLATNTQVRSVDADQGLLALSLDNHGRAFVTNGGLSTVSVVDLATGKLDATVPSEFAAPSTIAMSQDGTAAYLIGAGSNIRVFDTGTNRPAGEITGLNLVPDLLTVSPDGRRVYVSGYGDTIEVVDTAARRVIATPSLGSEPTGYAESQDSSHLYVTNGSSVSVLGTATNTVARTIPAGVDASHPVLSPDGGTLYVNIYTTTSEIDAIDIATGTVTATFAGQPPIAISPDGGTLYALGEFGAIDAISTASHAVTATIATPRPEDVATSADHRYLYLLDGYPGTQTVQTLDTATNTITATVDLTGGPWSQLAVR